MAPAYRRLSTRERRLIPVPELGEFIIENEHTLNPEASAYEMNRIMTSIKLAAKMVNRELKKAGLGDVLGSSEVNNVQGEDQQKLDYLANELFINTMTRRKMVAGICSEEDEEFLEVNQDCSYIILMDPLDGSSNIDVNVSVGSIFSIYKRVSEVGGPVTMGDFLQPGNKQIAAGYVLYGASTEFVVTLGSGVQSFTLDPSLGTFYLSHRKITFPPGPRTYSINEGNWNTFSPHIKQWISKCQRKGVEDLPSTPCSIRDTDKSMETAHDTARDTPATVTSPQGIKPAKLSMSNKYIGSLVSDFHRNLHQGGIFLYPGTKKNPDGKLRLLYECNPMAFLAEQAHGMATDGNQRILDIQPTKLHQRTPLFVGNTELINDLLHTQTLP